MDDVADSMVSNPQTRLEPEPLISVGMPAYNAECYIGEAVQSILDQSYHNWELIVVDDGSTDRTLERIRSFTDPRVRWLSQDNQGPSVGYNRALTESRGKYFAVLNADDVSYPDRLQRQLAAYQSGGRRVLFGEVDFIDAKGQPFAGPHFLTGRFETRRLTRGQILQRFFTVGNVFCMPTVFGERDVFLEAGPFDCSLFHLQDFEMWVRLVKKYDLCVLPGPVTKYRIHDDNLTGPRDIPDLERQVAVQNERHSIMRRLFDDVSPELFHEAFGDTVVRPGCTSELDLKCEQAFLYLNSPNKRNKFIGIEKFGALLNEPEARGVLKEHYGFTPLSFVNASKTVDITNLTAGQHTAGLQQELLREKERWHAELQRVVDERRAALQTKDDTLREVLQSRSWRITAPLRLAATKLRALMAGGNGVAANHDRRRPPDLAQPSAMGIMSGYPSIDRYLADGYTRVRGMSSRFAGAICGYLIHRQSQTGISGELMEIGVFEGRFFILMALGLAPGEHALGIDVFTVPDEGLLARFLTNCALHGVEAERFMACKTDSRKLTADGLRAKLGGRPARFIHIDGDHLRESLTIDLENAHAVLHPAGIICLDDMVHPAYPTLVTAVLDYLARHPEMRVLCVIDREDIIAAAKFLLCREDCVARYEQDLMAVFAQYRPRMLCNMITHHPFILTPRPINVDLGGPGAR